MAEDDATAGPQVGVCSNSQGWLKWKAGAVSQPSAVILPSTAISGIPPGRNPLQILHPHFTAVDAIQAVEGTAALY